MGYKTQPWMNGQEVAPATLLKVAAPLACRAQLEDGQWAQLSHRVRDVSAITISMLPPDQLNDLWVRPAWLPCAAPAHPDTARLFALLAASAQRDWPAMEQQGREWLTRPVANTSMHQDFADWALQTVLLSLAQRQQWAALKEAESTLGSQVKSQGVARLNRTLLVKIAQQQLATQ